MDVAILVENLYSFMLIAATIAGVPLATATVFGVLIAVFQATTQIQDQTLSQTVRIVVISIVLLMTGGALFSPLLVATNKVFAEIAFIGR